jgi:hypothetical protein
MRGEIPLARWAAFATVASASKDDRVVVVCRNDEVRCQYERAIPRLGGKHENVIFQSPSAERTPS